MAVRPVLVDLLTVGSCEHPGAVARRGAPWRPVEFPSLVAVIRHPDHGVVLLDTGYAPRYATATRRGPGAVYGRLLPMRLGRGRSLAEQLPALGIDPADVATVVVSHLHADHVAGLRDLPAARVVLDADALASHVRRGPLGRLRRGFLPALLPDDLERRVVDVATLPRWVPDAPRDPAGAGDPQAPQSARTDVTTLGPAHDLLGDGSVVVVRLPGHAHGQVGLLVASRAGDVLLVGDAAWSLRAITHLELPHPVVRLVTHSWGAYRATLGALHRLHRTSPGLLVVPSHCPVAIDRARLALAAARP